MFTESPVQSAEEQLPLLIVLGGGTPSAAVATHGRSTFTLLARRNNGKFISELANLLKLFVVTL